MSFRIGVVAYLNAKPLTWAIERGEIAGAEPVPAVPSELARQLLAGELDAAIVSSVLPLREPRLAVLGECGCIAADGPVQSVLLFTRVHVEQIRSVSLDRSSLASVALTRVLLERRYGLRPVYRTAAPELHAMLAESDAALIIGDPGLAQYTRGRQADAAYDVLDLGRLWREWTGLPFVFALWVAAPRVDRTALSGVLRQALVASQARVAEIAAAESARLALPEEVCRHYLEHIVRYEFGEREQRGWQRFGELVRELDDL